MGELKSKKFPWGPCPLNALEVGIRSVFILDPCVRRTVINPPHQKHVCGVIEMTLGLIGVSLSLPEWLSLKLAFFAHWG